MMCAKAFWIKYSSKVFMISCVFCWKYEYSIKIFQSLQQKAEMFCPLMFLSWVLFNGTITLQMEVKRPNPITLSIFYPLCIYILLDVPFVDWDWELFDSKFNSLIRILSIGLFLHFPHTELVIHNLSVQMLILNFDGKVPYHKLWYGNASVITFTDTEHHNHSFRLRGKI